MKLVLPIIAVCLLSVGCADQPKPEVHSEVFHVEVTEDALYASGTLNADDEQGFEFVAPDEPGFVRVGVEMNGDMGFYSNDDETALEDGDCVDESTAEAKGCIYASPGEVVFVKLRGIALSSEYMLSIVFKGIGTTP